MGVFFLKVMVVIKSKITGYCHGVDSTIKNALSVLKKAKKLNLPAYSIGNLIHNSDVVKGFEKQGLVVIEKPNVTPGVALVRAHGIPDKLKREFKRKNFILVDSTCENILKTKTGIKEASRHRRNVVVIGVRNHAETNCLLGTGRSEKTLVSGFEDLDDLFSKINAGAPVSVAVQTTFPEETYYELVKAIKAHYKDVKTINRLCVACVARKTNGLRLAQQCDAVFVVGGKQSSNTKELATWIKQSGKPVYQVENVKNFTPAFVEEIKKYSTVGLCSGTSTPTVIIDEVYQFLEKLN